MCIKTVTQSTQNVVMSENAKEVNTVQYAASRDAEILCSCALTESADGPGRHSRQRQG